LGSVDQFQHCLRAAEEEVPAARHELKAWLEATAVEADAIYDFLVVASELVTNGVVHSAGADVTVRAWHDDASLSLEVISREPSNPCGGRANRPERDPGEAGRGLLIVRELAEDYRVDLRGPDRVVSCRLSLR
jgi:anti-sigma regulatory factor (Ser/Thr protein kinase)